MLSAARRMNKGELIFDMVLNGFSPRPESLIEAEQISYCMNLKFTLKRA